MTGFQLARLLLEKAAPLIPLIERFMASKNYVCERCGGLARIVHHKKYIDPHNIYDVEITLSWANLEALCINCHNAEHMSSSGIADGLAFDEHGNPVRMG